MLSAWCARAGTEVGVYGLIPNHVHLILVPADADGLRAPLGEAHRRYTRHVNVREGWRGRLWQGRLAAFPMDEDYLLPSAHYVELISVRATLCRSLRAKDDALETAAPLLGRVAAKRVAGASLPRRRPCCRGARGHPRL